MGWRCCSFFLALFYVSALGFCEGLDYGGGGTTAIGRPLSLQPCLGFQNATGREICTHDFYPNRDKPHIPNKKSRRRPRHTQTPDNNKRRTERPETTPTFQSVVQPHRPVTSPSNFVIKAPKPPAPKRPSPTPLYTPFVSNTPQSSSPYNDFVLNPKAGGQSGAKTHYGLADVSNGVYLPPFYRPQNNRPPHHYGGYHGGYHGQAVPLNFLTKAKNVVEETPIKETPIKETPIKETPIKETPIKETPIKETPIKEISTASSAEPHKNGTEFLDKVLQRSGVNQKDQRYAFLRLAGATSGTDTSADPAVVPKAGAVPPPPRLPVKNETAHGATPAVSDAPPIPRNETDAAVPITKS